MNVTPNKKKPSGKVKSTEGEKATNEVCDKPLKVVDGGLFGGFVIVPKTGGGIDSTKKSKKGPLTQIVPSYQTLKQHYTLLWDMPSNEGYINIVAVMQKFFDQAISGNWSYNPKNYPDNEVEDVGKEIRSIVLQWTGIPTSIGVAKTKTLSKIANHIAKGHKVVIISAATSYQIEPVAKALGIKEVYATEMEIHNGKFTGRVSEMCWGEGKARAARKFAKKKKIDLSKSYFYTDSIDDYPLMKIVGKPVATNPDQKLSQMAFENNWPILRFEEPVEKPLINGFRTALAAASIYPSAVKGLIKGVLTMSRQEAADTTFSSVGDLGSMMAGLDIAVKGKHNLEEIRPAVFCFNHQSAADFFIVMKLIRHDFTGIAKKELERTPFGPIFKVLGAIFVDRSNKTKAIDLYTKSMANVGENQQIIYQHLQ